MVGEHLGWDAPLNFPQGPDFERPTEEMEEHRQPPPAKEHQMQYRGE
jgi:hypothetical protein